MAISDWLTLLAIVIGPVLAVQAQKWIERFRDTKTRRENIFKTLMATRGANLSWQHVEALNRIDLEFPDKGKYKRVADAWKTYFDHLSDREYGKGDESRWGERRIELLTKLLSEMAATLKYDFDTVQIKRNAYSPTAHLQVEEENTRLRRQLLEVLDGKRVLPVLVSGPEPTETQTKIQTYILEQYEGKRPLKVVVVDNELDGKS